MNYNLTNTLSNNSFTPWIILKLTVTFFWYIIEPTVLQRMRNKKQYNFAGQIAIHNMLIVFTRVLFF